MLNGAVTWAPRDGANVEIHELVGDDNIYIFGKRTEDVLKLYVKRLTIAARYYEGDPLIRELVGFHRQRRGYGAGRPGEPGTAAS